MRIALLLVLTTFAGFQPADQSLRGLWLKESKDQREFRFYYFHSDGIGLYRYGRRNLNNTNSYDYRLEGRDLILTFRKTGEQSRIAYRVERKGKDSYLVLDNDPREQSATRYRRVEGPLEMVDVMRDHPFARMWTERRTFATGGMGFRIYQFQAPDQNGRGHGWYHQGDYDDWSTEAFSYEKEENNLHFYFLEKKEREVSQIREASSPKRSIELSSDPRNFWHRARFEDGGRSIIELGDAALLGPFLSR